MKALRNFKQVYKILFYAVGVVFTIATILTATHKYLSHPSRQVVRETFAITTFPKILICTASLHSNFAASKLYPDMVQLIPALYGYNKTVVTRQMAENVTVNLSQFYRETRADLQPVKCVFNGFDCMHIVNHRLVG